MNKNILTKICIGILLIISNLLSNKIIAQTPGGGIFFQAVARDNFSNPAKDRKIYIQSTIIQTTENGTKVLIEEHQSQTDPTGVFSISLGQGTRKGGTAANLASIEWVKGPYYLNLKIAIQPIAPVSNWDYTKELIDLGTTPFGTVPYAMYSASSGALDSKLSIADTSKMLAIYAKAQAVNSLATQVVSKLSATDTATMLAPYAKMVNAMVASNITSLTAAAINAGLDAKVNVADSGVVYVTPQQLKGVKFDTTSLIAKVDTKVNIADSLTRYVTPTQLASKTFDSTAIYTQLALKLNKADTSTLSNRINLKANTTDLTSGLALKFNKTDTSFLLQKVDTITLSNRINLKANNTDVTNGLALKLDASQRGVANGVASLDANSKVPAAQIPVISFSSASVVANEAAMLALSGAIVGSIAIRTDVSKNFVLSAAGPSVLSNWVELATPTSVTSINGIAGPTVSLTTNEITEGATNKYYTDTRARNAISASAPLNYNAATGTLTMTAATASSNGFLRSADFTTFNNKQNALVAGTDYATPSGNITGNAANVTGVVSIINGGTGTTTATGALTNLGAEPTANKSTAIDLGNTSPSDILFPSQKAIKTYVDAQTAAAGVLDGSITNAKLAGSITASKLVGTDITTVGTITTGVWSGTTIALNKGGTGATTAAAARTNLGLAIGTDVLAYRTFGTAANSSTSDFVAVNASITGATKTKVTYDAKGLVTAGADATTADIAPSTDRNYVTDAQKSGVLSNTSGINTGDETATTIKTKLGIATLSGSNTGDQTIALTGDVTGAGTGSFAATLTNTTVTAGSYGSSTAIPTFTVDSKGRLTAASTVGITAGVNSLNYTNTTSYAAGGTISGTSLTLTAADASNPGLISTGAQTIAGAKTFNSNIIGNLSGNATSATTAGNITATSNTSLTSLSALTTVGTITTGTWSASTIDIAHGGTGLTSVGTSGQVLSSNGTSIAWTNPAATGITSINGITSGTQTLTVGTTGTAPAFSSASSTHTLNIPLASATSVTAGLLSKSDYDVFNAKQAALTAGSGVTISSNIVSVGQTVTTSASPTFAGQTLTGTLTGTTANFSSNIIASNLSGTNTGDETGSTIKTKLGITTLSGSNTGDQTITLTGDVTGTGTGSFAATLTNTTVTAASYGSSTAIPTFTVDAKGRLTTAGTTSIIADAGTLSGTITTAGKVANSATTATNANTANAIVARDASGNFTAGTITGTLSGTANNANRLSVPKNINGIPFDGTGDINITVSAGNLTGTTLANNIVTSSLTSVGTITSGVWSGTAIAIANGGTGATTNAGARTNLGLAIGTDVLAYRTFGSAANNNTADFVASNASITGATKTKITYDAKGLVTAGADATTADIAPSTDRNYVTDAQKSGVLSNTSGINTGDETASTIKSKLGITTLSGSNTGDQTITLTGDVTGTGTGSFTSTVTKINGTSLSTLATGILKNTTSTGVPTIAVAGTDYQLPISLTTTGASGTATFTSNTLNIPTYTLAGLGGIGLSGLSATAPLSYNNGTGAFSIPAATSSANGYLSSTDWSTFNNKQAALTAGVGSGISISGGTISATGLTTSNLSSTAGITNAQLASSTTTLGSTIMSLGGTVTSVTGLSSVSSTGFTGALTGNASTATTLATARNINGTSFNGSADITIIADAGTLSGTTLKSTVISSSLTGVGTITSGTWNGSTLAVAYGGTGVTTSTGSGNVVLSTSPNLVTPNLGTPSSATLTNATGLPIATGVSGLGTGIASFLATPTSSNLISAVTDETGTGALVFANTPTLVTPVIGAATGTSLSLTGTLSAGTSSVTSSTISGNETVGGTLGVTGATTLTALTTTGAATFSSTVKISTGAAAGKVLTSDASGNATWQNTGGTVVTMSATGTATSTATYIIFTGSTASQTITIPSAVTLGAGREITIKNVASVSVSIASAAGYLIQDNSTLTSATAALGIEPSNNWMKLVSDGTNWYIFRALF